MEILASQSESSGPLIKAQWEWKSNANPFSSEPPQWQPYRLPENYLLEKAHHKKQQEVDLGDYIVSLKDMLQKKKGDTFRQRPVRRNESYIAGDRATNKEDEGRDIRFFGAETPRTINKTFGTLSDYLKFFENRGVNFKKIAKAFREIEISKNLEELHLNIVPLVVECIQNESQIVSNTLAKNKLKQHQKYAQDLLLSFQQKFTRLKQFYSSILRAYTMEGFLYRNLNRYLRNEDWVQFDRLLPYAFCLCQAFFCIELTVGNDKFYQQSSNFGVQNKLLLYRGAGFDENSLKFYDPTTSTTKNFCWNGVTSTSTNRAKAEEFMYNNISLENVPVMFIIEVDLLQSKKLKTWNWIDIKPFSAIPTEDEVILAPGSVFQVIKFTKVGNKGVEVQLKMIENVDDLAHAGQIMHGTLQCEMITDGVAKIVCLQKSELSEALTHLKGNQAIEEVEFSLCKYDERTLKKMAETLKTMNRLKKLVLVNPVSSDKNGFYYVMKELKECDLKSLEIYDSRLSKQEGEHLSEVIRHWTGLKLLTLNFTNCEGVSDQVVSNLCFHGLKYLTSLTFLSLNFDRCRSISDKAMDSLSSDGLKHLTFLTSLSLSFHFCDKITDKGVNSLSSNGLEHLTFLTSLSLTFDRCFGITDEGVNFLCSHGLRYLTSLTSFTLSFYCCSKITNKGVNTLSSHGLRHLISLTSLSLTLDCGDNITDEGVDSLCSYGLQHLTSLKSLSLNFQTCWIRDKGVKSLCSHGLQHLTSLTSLSITFDNCQRITDEGVNSLCSQGLQDLTSLTSLSLIFGNCRRITDEGVNILCSHGLQHLTSLTSLYLKFGSNEKITQKGQSQVASLLSRFNSILNSSAPRKFILTRKPKKDVSILKAEGIQFSISNSASEKLLTIRSLKDMTILVAKDKVNNISQLRMLFSDTNWNEMMKSTTLLARLISLTSLSLMIRGGKTNYEITDEDVNILCSHGLQHLTSLTSLSLNFDRCFKITDEGVNILSSHGLQHLTSLTSLSLNFDIWHNMTDIGVNSLCSHGLQHLTSLTSLSLTFCNRGMTDKGVNSLCSQVLQYLTSLTSLSLGFHNCTITDQGVNSLCSQGLQHLTNLASLSLTGLCKGDQAVKILSSYGLQYLTSLTSLSLGFHICTITDQGVNNLSFYGLQHLTSLTSLSLTFDRCDNITDEGVNFLCSHGLRYLTFLISLSLNFGCCDNITDLALCNFAKILRYFGFESV